MKTLADLKNAPAALTAWFAPILAKWPSQFAGDKPTQAMLAAAVLIDGFKNGSPRPGIELLHIAMTLRPNGCTVQQFCTAGSCGPANNRRRRLVKQGLLSVTVQGKPYAFCTTVTAKGWLAITAAYNVAKAVASERAAVKKSDAVTARNGKGAKAAATVAAAALAKAATAAKASKAKGVKAKHLAKAAKAAAKVVPPVETPKPQGDAPQGDTPTPQV